MSVLEEIVELTKADLVRRRANVSDADIHAAAAATSEVTPAVDVARALNGPRIAVIAEVKRRSPSAGSLADIADPSALAREYEAGGAAMISVLTEPHRFGGSIDDLRAVRAAVNVPILRKDFIVDEYQIAEARAVGADCVLLIVAALADERLHELIASARGWGMEPLVEVHDADEARRAVRAGAQIIGVNARNLATLEVDTGTFARVVGELPHGVIAVAESGIGTVDDVRHLASAGAAAVLVGQTLVQSRSPRAAVREFADVERIAS